MAMTAQRAARRAAARSGHVVERPLRSGTLPLTYVRTGPRGRTPVLMIPGGPGMAAVAPYVGLRREAARRGLDVVMMEPRGVGLSRRDASGVDLRVEDVTIDSTVDDLAAVFDHAGIDRAVVYGTSYGTYVAQAFAARHLERVDSLVLDSPMLAVEDDLRRTREHRRRLLWEGRDPATEAVASEIRALASEGEPAGSLAHVAQVVYEFAGPEVLLRLVRARRRGRLSAVWSVVAGLGSSEMDDGIPYVAEPDLVAGIAYGELGFGLPPAGGPLDPQLFLARSARTRPPYAGEPFDHASALPGFDMPVVVLSGDRDLRTPRPVAERIVSLAPGGVLVPLRATGHSAMDTHRSAALAVATAAREGTSRWLPALAGRLADLPRRGATGALGPVLSALVNATTPRA